MRLIRRLFSIVSGAAEPREKRPCRRWERAIYLSVSEDLPVRSARALERHLERCPRCREEQLRTARALQRCRGVALHRSGLRMGWEAWPAVLAGVESESAPAGKVARTGWGVVRPLRLGIAAAAAAVVLIICLVAPSFLEQSDGKDPSGTASLEARWSKEWDSFVSGMEPGADPAKDPFVEVIPNPEVVEF